MAEPDDTVITLMSDLSACLCAQLAELAGDEEPPTCFCTPIPGQFPGQTYLGKGADIAWVRLADSFPSNTPGQQLNVPYDRVAGTTLLLEMAVMRCRQLGPKLEWSEEKLHDAWVVQMRDWGAMRRAIECCTGRSWDENQFVVGNYQPVGFEAEMFGGMIAIAMQIEV